MKKLLLFLPVFFACYINAQKISSKKIDVIAYYAGNATDIDAYPVEDLTQIIFSFCHLKDDSLHVRNENDTLTIQHLVELKKRNPSLKIILSIGGWGGCETCSEVFSTDDGRKNFAASVKQVSEYFKTDGIDIDWEYPAIEGFPNHQYLPADKQNFTSLLKTLRDTLGKKYEISFAAGGFNYFLKNSVEWNKVAPLVDNVNLMSYDLVNGNSTLTGHHTPLYSTPQQIESTDNAVKFFDSIHFPLKKIVIGAAMYGRLFDIDSTATSGLYQHGSFEHGVSWKNFNADTMRAQGYIYYWDDAAKAPYMYSQTLHKFLSYDDEQSITLKTKYVITKGLGGIMFWQLGDDKPVDGLLSAIDKAKNN